MHINYGLFVIHKSLAGPNIQLGNIEHFCGYEEEPDNWKEAKEALKQELIDDPEFELEYDIEEYVFYKATEKIVQAYNAILESAEYD